MVRKGGGKAYAVYSPGSPAEFEQNDMLLENGRIDAYGAADFSPESPTALWLRMHVQKICDRISREVDEAVQTRLGKAPRHIHNPRPPDEPPQASRAESEPTLF